MRGRDAALSAGAADAAEDAKKEEEVEEEEEEEAAAMRYRMFIAEWRNRTRLLRALRQPRSLPPPLTGAAGEAAKENRSRGKGRPAVKGVMTPGEEGEEEEEEEEGKGRVMTTLDF